MESKKLVIIRSDIISEFQEVRPITSSEYDKFKNSVSTLSLIKNYLNLFQGVILNFQDYISALNNHFQEFHENENFHTETIMNSTLNLNRLLNNYLSSVRLFLDHMEYDLKKRHGNESEIVFDFKSLCSDIYDKNFSYRFIYHLRNYVQHCGMPIGHISFKSKVDDHDRNRSNKVLELKFNRDELLREHNWKKDLKSEIEILPSKFDINPHIVDMNE